MIYPKKNCVTQVGYAFELKLPNSSHKKLSQTAMTLWYKYHSSYEKTGEKSIALQNG
jgi:hypothetical protein